MYTFNQPNVGDMIRTQSGQVFKIVSANGGCGGRSYFAQPLNQQGQPLAEGLRSIGSSLSQTNITSVFGPGTANAYNSTQNKPIWTKEPDRFRLGSLFQGRTSGHTFQLCLQKGFPPPDNRLCLVNEDTGRVFIYGRLSEAQIANGLTGAELDGLRTKRKNGHTWDDDYTLVRNGF